MRRHIITLSVALIFLVTAGGLHAQTDGFYNNPDTANFPYWTQMMQDPSILFHATQSAFEKYWAGRSDYKGNGWKVFKRWEYINETTVRPDGKLPAPDYVMNEMARYRASHSQKSLSGNWSLIGPTALPANSTSQPNGLGRVNCVAFHPANQNVFYAGSPSGGLWKTTDGGSTWSVLITSLPSIGVSAILLHPTDENLILVGTGDRDASDAPGIGVYKSTDGGSSFVASNSGMGTKTVGMLIRHPSNPSVILAATSGGIYKSSDGGSTWTLKSSNSSNYKDIRFKPNDPAVVYATENGKFYRSTNTGDSWTQITSGIITGTRLVIGVSPNQPDWVYLLQTNGAFAGLLRSTNAGVNFSTQSTTPNIMDYSCDGSGTASQAWYDLCIAVDPANASTIYAGGVNIFKSTNGGVNWTINSHWVGASWGVTCAPSVHADIHSLDFSPVNSWLYTGCDGGVYWTGNGGIAWNDISSGLSIAQVYKIGQSATSQGLTINGYQDNGTATNSGTAFTTVIGGDGMECLIDYSNSNIRYGELYYGNIRRTTGSGYSTIAANGSNGINESGGWVTPFILHETDPAKMFIGYKNVWRSTNVNAASPSSVSWTKITSGWTNNCTILEQSPANVDILYVVFSGSIQRTDNANAASPTWTACALPGGATPTDLEAHPTDPNIIYATAGYFVYKSTDKGATWTSISGTLPSITLNTIVYDKNTSEGLYVGNQTGVYYRDASLTDWIPFNSGLPNVNVRELEIFYDATTPGNSRLKAATYGRGLWESDLYSFFTISPMNQDVAYPAGTTNFTITASASLGWTAVSDASWCSVPASGTGSATLTASYEENPTVTSRVAIITLSPSGLSSQTVTVTQAPGPPTLSVTPPNRNVDALAGSADFYVTSNTDWTVTSDASWCTVTPAGTAIDTITATYEENPTIYSRVANITVTVTGLTPVTVTVSQGGATPSLGVTPINQDVTDQSGSTTFSVTSNTDWTVTSDAAWCVPTSAGSGNGTIIADYEANTSLDSRVANLTVTVSTLPPQIVTVTQAGAAPQLNVTPVSRNVASEAGNTDFTVTSNADWNASSDVAWCTVTSSGSGDGTIVADYTENTQYDQRTANISVTVNGLPPQTVTVVQEASTVSTGELADESIRIFPNPSKGLFTILTPAGVTQDLEVTVRDLEGKIVYKKTFSGTTTYTMDLSGTGAGSYQLTLRCRELTLVKKLVILR
jgi:photosystem II stability/assembly factor-like uncharacterized protein